MTSTELVTLLRSQSRSLETNANVSSIDGLTFEFSNGTKSTVKFNSDKSWRVKPSDTDCSGFVKIVWTDSQKNYSSVIGNVYTIVEKVESVFIDPSQVVNFHFNYTETKQTNVNVEGDTDNE